MSPPASDGDMTGGQVYVDGVDLLILESLPERVEAIIKGQLPDGCTEIRNVTVAFDAVAQVFSVQVVTQRDPELMCTEALVPFEETVELDMLGPPAGTYTVDAHGVAALFEFLVDNALE